jgi:hypothetical protein
MAVQVQLSMQRKSEGTDMRRVFFIKVVLALLALFISPAQAAINIQEATAQGGVAFIKGDGAVRGAPIYWEGFLVATAKKSKAANFSFFG